LNTKLIYTCLFGPYDDLKQPRLISEDFDYVCYTDQDIQNPGVWQIVKPQSTLSPKLLSRLYKINPPNHNKYEVTVYVDASYQLYGDFNEFVKDMGEGVHMTKHPQRQCVYEEAKIVLDKKLDSEETISKQVAKYRGLKYPENNGLYRCGVIVRRGNTKSFDKIWWKEIEGGSWRDQISAPFAAFWSSIKIQEIPHGKVERFMAHRLHNPREISPTNIILCSTVDEIKVASKDTWINWKNFPNATEEITKHPFVPHLIVRGESMIFQRVLFDYIPFVNEMLKYVKAYNGKTVVYLNTDV